MYVIWSVNLYSLMINTGLTAQHVVTNKNKKELPGMESLFSPPRTSFKGTKQKNKKSVSFVEQEKERMDQFCVEISEAPLSPSAHGKVEFAFSPPPDQVKVEEIQFMSDEEIVRLDETPNRRFQITLPKESVKSSIIEVGRDGEVRLNEFAHSHVCSYLNKLQEAEDLKVDPHITSSEDIGMQFNETEEQNQGKTMSAMPVRTPKFQEQFKPMEGDDNSFKNITEDARDSFDSSSSDSVIDIKIELPKKLPKQMKKVQSTYIRKTALPFEETQDHDSENHETDSDGTFSMKSKPPKRKRGEFKRLTSTFIDPKQLEQSKIKTELIDKIGKSEYKIVHGFWMLGDFYMLVTLDSIDDKYYLELFQYSSFDIKNSVFNQVDKMELFQTKDNVTFSISEGESRHLVSMFVEVKSYQTQKVKSINLYLLDSDKFNKNPVVNLSLEVEEQKYRIQSGLRKIPDDDLRNISTTSDYSGSAFQMFAYNNHSSEPELYVFFQQNVKNMPMRAESIILSTKSSSQNYHLRLFKVTPSEIFQPRTKRGSILRQSTVKGVVKEVKHFKFLDKRIVGVFRLEKRLNIVVYQDGSFQQYSDNPEDPPKQLQLVLPFKKATHCLITKFENQQPMLIFQSKSYQTVGFVFEEGAWNRKFTIEEHKYKLKKAFGPFMVGTSIKDQTVKLLELGGKRDDTIVTEMSIGRPGQTDLEIDAFIRKSNFAVTHEYNSTKFTWYKFDQQRQLHHMKNDTITQVCENFLIEFNLLEGSFSFSQLDRIEEGEVDNQLFKVSLSKQYHQGTISSFFPVINPSQTYMVLAISYGSVENTKWLDEKFQGWILIDLERREIYQPFEAQPDNVRLQEPFKSIMFKSDMELLCQNSLGVFQLLIIVTKCDQQLGEQLGKQVRNQYMKSLTIRNAPEQATSKHSYTIQVQDYKVQSHYEDYFILGTRMNKILILSAQMKQIFSINEQQVEISQAFGSLVKNRVISGSVMQKQASLSSKLAPKLAHDELAVLQYPELHEINDQKFERWSACMNSNKTKLYVLFSNANFAWIYSFSFLFDNSLVQDGDPDCVSQRHAMAIYYLNDSQIAIQTDNGLCIYNTTVKKIDWKVQFKYNMNVEFTVSKGYIAVPRSTNGVLLEFGTTTIGDRMQKTTTHKDKLTFPDLNHILVQFRDNYKSFIGGYLCINERFVNWDSRHKIMPLNYHYDDYIHQKLTDNEQIVNEVYEETEFLCLAYNNDFTIWEALIRKGLLEERVQITDSQLDRICNPYLGDNNNSLLHKMSYHQHASLKQVFEKTTIADKFGQENKRYLFFQNFGRESQLDIALKKCDFESFEYLLDKTILLQNCFESAHLADTWLIEALTLGLNIRPLFESEIMSQQIRRDNFPNSKEFNHFHTISDTKTKTYQKSLNELTHSRRSYFNLFGKDYESSADLVKFEQEGMAGLKFVQQQREDRNEKIISSSDQKYSILYYVDYLFSTETDLGKVHDRFEVLNERLSKTTHLYLFNSPLIQRYIDFQWESKLIWIFKSLLFSHIVSCFLIIYNIGCLDYDSETHHGAIRKVNNIIVAVIVLITVPFFEIRQMISDGWAYLMDFWNINDILFCVVLTMTIVADWQTDTTRTRPVTNPLTGLEEREELEITQAVQFTRICYGLLAITSFIKLLSLLRIYNNISFIIKMLFRVSEELTPFLFLFMGFVGTFSVVVVALDMQRDNLEEDGDPYAGLGGIGYFMFVLRTSFGDFSVDPFKDMPKGISIFMWILWLIIIFCNTIVFLNFIIAVISDSYEQIMDTRIEEIYQKKAQLLADIQSVFGKYSTKNANILVTRTSSSKTDDFHWNGFVSEIKRSIEQNTKANSLNVSRSIEGVVKGLVKKQEEMHESMMMMHNKLEDVTEIKRQLKLLTKVISGNSNPGIGVKTLISQNARDSESSQIESEDNNEQTQVTVSSFNSQHDSSFSSMINKKASYPANSDIKISVNESRKDKGQT